MEKIYLMGSGPVLSPTLLPSYQPPCVLLGVPLHPDLCCLNPPLCWPIHTELHTHYCCLTAISKRSYHLVLLAHPAPPSLKATGNGWAHLPGGGINRCTSVCFNFYPLPLNNGNNVITWRGQVESWLCFDLFIFSFYLFIFLTLHLPCLFFSCS